MGKKQGSNRFRAEQRQTVVNQGAWGGWLTLSACCRLL